MTKFENLPILIGVGQSVERWDGTGDSPTPITLAKSAVEAALANCGNVDLLRTSIDWVAFVRLIQDSVEGRVPPHGTFADPAASLCELAGITPKTSIHSGVGGDQPQFLVNEAAAALVRGDIRVALITGAEAMATVRTAKRFKKKIDWTNERTITSEDRGTGTPLLTKYERENGLGAPLQTYAAFDHALRGRLKLDKQGYRDLAAKMLAGFSRVAENNPYAYFPDLKDAAFLATESTENRAVADPFLKWHVAQEAVDQGAALIMTTVGTARELGVDETQWIYLHGHAQVEDTSVVNRPDLSRSTAIQLVLEHALKSSGITINEILHMDLYSCFPSVPLLACETLGIDPLSRELTVTGGLPFFGGPGNNYSAHAIASMVERLRVDRESYGLILANGGFMTKEAAGVYSAIPPKAFSVTPKNALDNALAAAGKATINAKPKSLTVEGYCVVEGRSGESFGYVIGSSENGRALAKVRSGHLATLRNLKARDPLGRTFEIIQENEMNYIKATDKLGKDGSDSFWDRKFENVIVKRDGSILEVTLNRVDRYNALHGPAHRELHEIFDSYEQDPELWVAILTGAEEKAFCSGNDLKATSEGHDIKTQASGFGGLCSRWGREKPVICAVNGVAMGGGCEIVLASDIAIADAHAKFALPEVKVGLFAAGGGVLRLTRQIGHKAAMELILTGRTITAAKAAELGIINRVAPEGQTAMDVAREIAKEIIMASPTAVRASKRVINNLEENIDRLPEAFEMNMPEFLKVMKTNDGKEGVAAFVEKRAPKWTNS